MTELKSIADQTRQVRKERGESQLTFAAGCNISVDEISLIERQRADPRLSTLRKIAEYVGLTVSDLVRLPEPPCRYCVQESSVRDEEGVIHTCYDIECRGEESDTLLDCAPAMFLNFKEAFAFACLLNRERLRRCHFREVVEDYLAK